MNDRNVPKNQRVFYFIISCSYYATLIILYPIYNKKQFICNLYTVPYTIVYWVHVNTPTLQYLRRLHSGLS